MWGGSGKSVDRSNRVVNNVSNLVSYEWGLYFLPHLLFVSQNHMADEISHQLLTRQDTHKRIVWACSWNPFGHIFCRVSRDKTVKLWAIEKGSLVKILTILPPFRSSVTALSWVGLDRQSNYGYVAVGMENGLIELWSISIPRNMVVLL